MIDGGIKRDLKDIDYVKALQSNLHVMFDGQPGQEVMLFLEDAVAYHGSVWDPASRENTWIQDGKRQVVATLKTLLREKPETITALAKQKEA